MRFKCLERLEGAQQSFLHYFLRVRLIAGHAKRDLEKSAAMPVHDDFEGLVVPRQDLLDSSGINRIHSFPLDYALVKMLGNKSLPDISLNLEPFWGKQHRMPHESNPDKESRRLRGPGI